ncbi:dynein beta chain, ciliary-like [Anoplophora glabripennis]|uniref:dynein beta chain, ciliary-like n=1 Tax=Anoplophora glabripennis TaxID=217634 RepID=UPI0008752254|nr:dynein beta chain, ciliary-like [Anoplophora glabripennis]
MGDDDKKKKEEGKQDEGEDERLEFILSYLTKSYRLKQEKWNKMISLEENKKMILNFLNNPNEKMLIMTIPTTGLLTPMTQFSAAIKQKYTYFIRRVPQAVTMQNFRTVLSFGDMGGRPVEELAVLMEGVFVPLLSNPGNQRGWPKVVAEDVVSHVRDFKSNVEQIRGAMKSQTILPMPQGMSEVFIATQSFYASRGETVNLTLKTSYENAVMKWSTISNEVLKQSSLIAFANGANPTPRNEIEFWNARNKNLESIYDQLLDPRVRKMGEYLEITNSAYNTTYKNMFKNIVADLFEARDICMYLKTILPHISRFEDNEFLETENYIKPLVHCIGLLWANSKYYSSSDKIVILLKMISNMLIESAERSLDPSNIFQGDPEEVHAKLELSIKLINMFMGSFEYVRENLSSYYQTPQEGEEEVVQKPWTFHRKNVFQRLMDFAERLSLVKEILSTLIEFSKLEKVELGGIKGRNLSQKCVQIFEEFNKAYNVFNNIQYEILDTTDPSIIKDASIFNEKCADFDRRLAAVFAQAYDDCYNLESIFKFINVLGTLINRPAISNEVTIKYHQIIDNFNSELDIVKELYDDGKKNGVPLDKYYPKVAGELLWLYKLRTRISKPAEDMKILENEIVKSEDAENVFMKIEQMVGILDEEQNRILNTWCNYAPEQIKESMSKFQLVRIEGGALLQLNFDEELKAILREMRYLTLMEIQDIPVEALELYTKSEDLKAALTKFNRVVEWYNYLKRYTTQFEFALIEEEMKEVDEMLNQVTETYTWNTNDPEIVGNIFDRVKQVTDRVKKAQTNIKNLYSTIHVWALQPLFERKDGKKENLISLDDRQERIQKRYDLITACSNELRRIIEENYLLFFNEPMKKLPTEEELEAAAAAAAAAEAAAAEEAAAQQQLKGDKKGSKKGKKEEKEKGKKGKKKEEKVVEEIVKVEEPPPPPEEEDTTAARNAVWIPYVKNLDDEIKEMVMVAIDVSFYLFLKETGNSPPVTPFFELLLELHEPDVVFVPSADIEDPINFHTYVSGLLDDIFNMGNYMIRVNPDETTSYSQIAKDEMDIRLKHDEICTRIMNAMEKALAFTKEFDEYIMLWVEDRQEFLRQFLTYSRLLTLEEMEQLKDENAPGIKESPPTVNQFKEQIDYYENLYKKVEQIPPERILMDGWLRVDVKPLRQAILNIICKWGNMFKQHLYNRVIDSLEGLESFIKESIAAMQVPLAEDDYDGLLKVMGYLFKVKERQVETDTMFEPLKEIMELLKDYGVEFPEEIYVQLQEIPDRWVQCKKVSATTKQTVAPLQAMQVNAIKRRINLFEIRQSMYRDQFKKMPFFLWSCPNVYSKLDKTNMEISELETELAKLQEQSNLFELVLPDFKPLRAARKEIKQIKQLWDYVNVVRSCMDEWKTTPWKKIDVENMEMECKKFGKEIRQMDKELKGWDVYIQLEASIKNMLTSLRAVTELQNPAIRERHWTQLMQATKVDKRLPPYYTVRFVMSDDTTLSDLLALNLHEYEEEVKNIVDKAVKEMAMEKVLKELNATWSVMEFQTEYHERTKLRLLVVTEEVIETLEENQVALQNMMTSKFIDFFLEQVSDWQRKLSNADQVIHVFFDVQRKWSYLESIFIGSEDIRNQLPEDSKRFDKLDKEFKDVLNEMLKTPNIVQATNKAGLYDKLDNILRELTLCEKALNDYLDTKRLAFPRFYFVSSADLLDILSNGNQPDLIQRHLTKLFDSLAKLIFIQEGGKNTKKAKSMMSKENGEIVPFSHICDCSGKVEIWLNRVIDVKRETLHQLFGEAVITYDEKPREVWIYDFPAQTALCGTQIWWTTEVNMAFARLEEGYENALKDYQRKQINQLNALINMLLGDLTPGERQKIMTICTIDVHSRDVVAKMILMKVENSQAFQWQSQLRHRWDDKKKDCFANICDAEFRYSYEYLGNTPRLVITPLTDRCYITLTQSLHLIMGGAPAGPAGTGKTETTKDLGKALGMMVYVFNCSEQMDYKSIGNIYKGLAQTGCWGCFDEFNRISIEVLSVVAVQVKVIQDAIKDKKKRFQFLGQEIGLVPTVGLFITMNPGYAGRTELPENLKALFRPCAMVVPDFALICEIMLVAEGFLEARLLARKFITLYTLCKELLSKQDHYDWGLRAIKSVLVVAGSLKRSDRLRPEDQVLMRALRDFNIPKIVTDDVPIFMGLIGDLFPALDVPRKRDLEFEKMIRTTTADLKLQPEEGFILKVVQLEELFAVRHSVFIIGNAGTGKSMVWKTLNRTYANQKRKPFYNDLNPKAVTNDELFGIINPATREWKDGLFSVIMREQANLTGDGPKWIVLDGDIDPMWIESLNTLMDDNKVLTLASNERIALTASMRLLFEIANLRTATPATVSRAGILYINPADLGWNPFIASWIDTRTLQSEKANLMILFDKYVPPCLDALRTKFKKITPISDIAHLQMLCCLLDCFLTPQNVPPDCPKEWYEIYFVFSTVWAFGSALFQDQIIDWRNEFSKWFTNEFKTVKFPIGGNVFTYYIEEESKRFLPWTDLVADFELDSDIPLQATLVNTAETTRIRFFLDHLVSKKAPVMLVGAAGSGKTVIVADKLNALPDSYLITNVPFNFYTTSEMLQRILEKPLEKKAGRVYGPPGSKTMIYFIDDMNMPEVDKYFTVQPHTLLRQYMDYQHWYDRQKLALKDIHNVQFVSCMNPTAGSFTINPRLQRHFSVFAVSFPSQEASYHIYNSIYQQHLTDPLKKFNSNVIKVCPNIVQAALALHQKVATTFLPTAVKFHYTFTLRDMSNIFQGMLFATGDAVTNQTSFIRLWMHEASRVYGDKLVERKDIDSFNKLVIESVKKSFEEIDDNDVFEKPLIFCHFAEGIGDPKYFPIRDFVHLSRLLNDALGGYNDLVAAMNLVLFEDAMYHICRINRIMEAPRGNALLVGVGGSGKQSLTRLAAFISSFEVFQIQLKKGYSMNDMKADIGKLYLKSGLKSIGTVFLMTDAQVPEESYLVLINDLLASGEISELLPDEDVENVINAVRGEVKSTGQEDSRENCWKFFIDRVRRLLKVVLCFSPVGSTLRVRARKFPALVNSTSINWFHEWPQEALKSVSKRFLSEIEVLPPKLVATVSDFMSYVHSTVNDMSQVYLVNEKRYNYTTPKSFLEQIDLYSKLLSEKTADVKNNIVRLENGLTKLASTSEEVDGLKDILAVQEVELKEKNEAAGRLIAVLSAENEKVAKEQQIASEEEAKVKVIEEDVSVKAKICQEDLLKAEPALVAAQAALNTLNKNNLTELKSFATPPEAVVAVCGAVMVLFSKKGKIPKDRSWKECKLMMAKVDQFLNDLINYDKDNMAPEIVKATQEYLKLPDFSPEKIFSKSIAAAGLCSWVTNILKYYDVFVVVEPKRRALAQANKDLNDARSKLAELNEKLQELEKQLGVLRAEFEEATNAKLKCQAEADATTQMIDLANRLVNGLASENIRWRELVKQYKQSIVTMPGDVLLVTAFISYVGCFSRQYRLDLFKKYWLPYLKTLSTPIPMTEGLDPLSLLTDDAKIAQWNNESLPNDRMSTENACILTNSSRWPLMIDPQLQGVKWIKTKYGENLVVVRLTQRTYLDKIETCISNGSVILLENIGETLDAVLDSILGRVLIKKGRAIKIGDKEVDYNPKFKMILHTKLANPHYKPEIQAQTTLINFTVTRDGLEEQLLAEVVKAERPDLETLKSSLTKQQNDFKITLKNCEDNLLYKLSSATGNILGDVELVLNLETTKKTATEIAVKVEEAKVTSVKIDEAREQYRPCAARASLLYFILNDLNRINAIYQFSLKAFSVVFKDALARAEAAEKLKDRVVNLLDSITFSVFMYTSRGLFERDKLIFTAQMAFQILLQLNEIIPEELDFLLRFPSMPNLISPVDFLNSVCWGGIKSLSLLDAFKSLDKDLEGSAKRWRKFVDSECPEKEKLPGEWKNKTSLQRLCIMRCLRPDRMTYAASVFIEEKMGVKYVTSRTVEFEKSYEETSASTPTFFILSPGVNPLKDVEKLGKKLGFMFDKGNFHSVSLGQGQEIVAENAMDLASNEGHWVILQNIHLVQKWLATLEKKMEQCADRGHVNYRLYLSAEPSADPQECVIPQGILESSIKITNEPPTGMYANLHKALDNFNQETLEMSSKEAEFKAILFALCYFHAVVAERRKFGPQGWNRNYPFNVGDLTISISVLYNYLESNNKVPWEDLRYLFGEIMYGGHITDDWDRRLCRSYLLTYMQPELVEGELQFAPGFFAPPNTDYVGYHRYIDDRLPSESPNLYGLHPNAEIGFLAYTSEVMFRTIFEMQPRDAGAAAGGGMSREDKVKSALEDIMDKLPERFPVAEMIAKVEDKTPYIIVAFQECERMNNLTSEMKRSLHELDLGLKGELTITSDMETLEQAIFMDQVPDAWAAKAYPSLLPLGQWVGDLTLRIKELDGWVSDFSMPSTVWLGGFFNPQSFLTAIMQQTARKNEWPLDKMCLMTDVTKKQKEEFNSAPREGAYVHGLFMEGARWDPQLNSIADSKLKELFPVVPVIFIKAITQDKQDLRNMYDCPVYKTRMRGPTFVWTFNLKTKENPLKWTLAGVAILLQI